MATISQIINKGIPLDGEVYLDIEELYAICEDNEKASNSILQNYKNINKYFFNSFGINITKFMAFTIFSIKTDPITLKKAFFYDLINYNHFIANFFDEETLNKINCGEIALTNIFFQEKIRELKEITTAKELKKFKKLYFIYNQEKEKKELLIKCFEILKRKEKKINYTDYLNFRKEILDEIQKDGIEKNLEEEMEKAINFNVATFCNEMALIFLTFIEHQKEIIEYLNNTEIKFHYFNREVKDRLQLYILYKYINEMEDDNLLTEYRQKDLYYASECIRELSKTNIETTISKPNIKKEISFRNLYERYKKILVKYPELKIVNFSDVNFDSMSIEEIEDFMNEYLKDLQATWEIMPKGQTISVPFTKKERKRKEEKSEEEKEKWRQIQNHLLDKFIEKKEFYDSLDPMYRIKGINTFDGYCGFIFQNGIVVLDKFYENAKTERLSKGDAIYIMRLDQFYILSQYPRPYIYKNKLCRREYHKKGWQEIILNIIGSKNIGINTSLEMKKLFDTKKVNK